MLRAIALNYLLDLECHFLQKPVTVKTLIIQQKLDKDSAKLRVE